MQALTKHHWAILILSALYVVGFGAYYVLQRDYEFLWYVAVLVFFFALIFATLHRSRFDYLTLWGLSIWGLLHMAGGGVQVGEGILYALPLIPLVDTGDMLILKYDQFVHFFGFFVTTLVGYHLLKPYLNAKTNWKVVYPLLACIGIGAGALNEVVEFVAVLSFAETGVGGYTNNALDLVFNTLGAIVAVFVIHWHYRKNND